MPTNHARARLRRGEPTIGCFLGLGSPSVTELLAHAGFDWLVIETEHNAVDLGRVEHMLMAMNGSGTVPLVRVPSSDPTGIQRALDIGALGVVVPLVRTVGEAERIVAATRYPPRGRRGWGPLRASRYTLENADYFDSADDNILVVLILETAEALSDLAAIAAVDGIDALYVGPCDLSIALGGDPLTTDGPAMTAAVDTALEVGRHSGVAIGGGASTPAELTELLGRGMTMIGYGPDYRMLTESAGTGIATFQEHSASPRMPLP